MIQLFQFFGAAPCSGGDFLGFPKWYKYLEGVTVEGTTLCSPRLSGLNDIYLILAAIIEVLLRIAALLAVGYIIFGGIEYLMSQGEGEKTAQARKTITNALIGLVISISAAAVVAFFARTVGS